MLLSKASPSSEVINFHTEGHTSLCKLPVAKRLTHWWQIILSLAALPHHSLGKVPGLQVPPPILFSGYSLRLKMTPHGVRFLPWLTPYSYTRSRMLGSLPSSEHRQSLGGLASARQSLCVDVPCQSSYDEKTAQCFLRSVQLEGTQSWLHNFTHLCSAQKPSAARTIHWNQVKQEVDPNFTMYLVNKRNLPQFYIQWICPSDLLVLWADTPISKTVDEICHPKWTAKPFLIQLGFISAWTMESFQLHLQA